jgi:glucose-1-phosphate cytidylyltransferase
MEFSEKPQAAEGRINGAFFVLEPEVVEFIEGEHTQWEKEPMQRLSREGQLMAYRHTDFCQYMDVLRDKALPDSYWQKGDAPWKTWKD